jgi:hypothetical protein
VNKQAGDIAVNRVAVVDIESLPEALVGIILGSKVASGRLEESTDNILAIATFGISCGFQ